MNKEDLGDPQTPLQSNQSWHELPPRHLLDAGQHIWGEEYLNSIYSFALGSPCGLLFPGNAAVPTSLDV